MAPALSALIEMLWRKFRDAGGACVVDVTGVGRRPGRDRGQPTMKLPWLLLARRRTIRLAELGAAE